MHILPTNNKQMAQQAAEKNNKEIIIIKGWKNSVSKTRRHYVKVDQRFGGFFGRKNVLVFLLFYFFFSLAVKSRPGEQGECNCTAEPLFLAHLSCVRIVVSPSLFDALFRRGEESGDKRFGSLVLFRYLGGTGSENTFSSGQTIRTSTRKMTSQKC